MTSGHCSLVSVCVCTTVWHDLTAISKTILRETSRGIRRVCSSSSRSKRYSSYTRVFSEFDRYIVLLNINNYRSNNRNLANRAGRSKRRISIVYGMQRTLSPTSTTSYTCYEYNNRYAHVLSVGRMPLRCEFKRIKWFALGAVLTVRSIEMHYHYRISSNVPMMVILIFQIKLVWHVWFLDALQVCRQCVW